MRNSLRTRTIVAALVAAALIPVAPAFAATEDPFAKDLGGSGSDQASSIVERRDGSQATPFVAEVGPEASSAATTSVADDGFDIGAAAIGVGLGLLVATLAMLGAAEIRDRREHGHQRAPAATQGA